MAKPAFRSLRWSRHGFTLIELLVVLALIGLLVALAAPRYFGTLSGARESVRAQNLSTLRDALDKHRADTGRYPLALSELVTRGYLRAIPIDPVTDSTGWDPLPHPSSGEPGIYDVAPPPGTAASATPAQP